MHFRLLLVAVPLLAGAFVLGRASQDGDAFAAAGAHVYTGRTGDVFRVPAAATRCIVSQEGGFPDLFCTRMPRGRHQIVFFKDSVLVYRVGRDVPVFSARWQP